MVNQQKGVQQETAYSAVVVNGIPVPAYIIFSCLPLLGQKRYKDGGTYDHSLQLHYRQFLVALLKIITHYKTYFLHLL